MPIFMVGLGVALVVITVAIGLAVVIDVKKMIAYAVDPNKPTHGPRRG